MERRACVLSQGGRAIPISRDSKGFLTWPDAWGGPALGLETGRVEACVAEVQARGLQGVFGRHPEYAEPDLACLGALPGLRVAEFWDIKLRDLADLYGLTQLTHLRLSGKRPAIDLSRLPTLEKLVLEHHKKDIGLGALQALTFLNLWRFKADAPGAFSLSLPSSLESLGLFWSNIENLAGIGICPNVRRLEIARCRNLRDLGDLKVTFPKLEHLVVHACGRVTPDAARASLEGHAKVRHAFAGNKLLRGTLPD